MTSYHNELRSLTNTILKVQFPYINPWSQQVCTIFQFVTCSALMIGQWILHQRMVSQKFARLKPILDSWETKCVLKSIDRTRTKQDTTTFANPSMPVNFHLDTQKTICWGCRMCWFQMHTTNKVKIYKQELLCSQ